MNNSSQTYIIIVPGKPADLNLNWYRGDSQTLSFIARENDKTTPFNLAIFDTFKSQMRIGSAQNPNIIAELVPENFLLGQSQEALDYEIANLLPANSIMDELHCFYLSALLQELKMKKILVDVQATELGENTTLGAGTINLTADVTRP